MAIVHYAMQIEQLSDIKALVMRLKSDPVTGSKTQSWLRLCRKIKDNSRFITAPFRETKAFEKLYNQRTSVERTFGDLKDNYNLDNIRVAKMARAKVFMDLSCIALIASRLPDAASKEKTTKIVQIYHYKNSDIKRAILKQKPTELNPNPCHILSKTANHLSILNLLIEIFKIQARNAPRILIYYMEK